MARPADPTARAALQAAARAAFVAHGVQRARIEDITRACGLSKGAFYLHFGSKEALFGELVKALEARFEAFRLDREVATRRFLEAHGPVRPRDRVPGSAFERALDAAQQEQDAQLLELFWEWRDVIDVLLRGSQGTEFEGVMWAVLDEQMARVREECEALKGLGLMRDDVPSEVLGMMVVGTYLLVARRMGSLDEKPDFGPWVESLQKVLWQGTSPAPRAAPRPTRPARRRPAPRRAATRSHRRKSP